jgi:alpha-L-rhamnosidase
MSDWVWYGDRTKNVFRRFIIPFEGGNQLDITCFGQYRLYINGCYIARGPALSHATYKKYDSVDLTPILKSGKNLLCVEVFHFNYRTAHQEGAAAAIYIDIKGGEMGAIYTAENKCIQANGIRRNFLYGPMEIYDANKDQAWLDEGFDYKQWEIAEKLQLPDIQLVPRAIPMLAEDFIYPVTITSVGEVLWQEFAPAMHDGVVVNLAAYLLQDVPVPQRLTLIENIQGILKGEPVTVSQPDPLDYINKEHYCATIILDFGREITGNLVFEAEGNQGAVIDIAFCEKLIGGRVQPVRQNCGYCDRYILSEQKQRHEIYDMKGFRYVQLTFRNLTKPLVIHQLGLNYTRYPFEHCGEFVSDSDQLNQIWKVGAYTQQLCSHDHLMDCPWREQQEWLGDGRVQLGNIYYCFGDTAMIKSFINNFALTQHESGVIPAVSFCDEFIMLDYSLFWVMGLQDYALFTRDFDMVKKLIGHARKVIAYFDPIRNSDGLLESPTDNVKEGHIFIDWAPVAKEGICASYNAIYMMALKALKELSEYIGSPDESLDQRIKLLVASYHRLFFNQERQLYCDQVLEGLQTNHFSQHTQFFTVLAGLSQMDNKKLLVNMLKDDTLTKAEPYGSYYLCEALAQNGLLDEAVNYIEKAWGGMIERGATTFSEEWFNDATYRGGRWHPRPRSLCHAWSAWVSSFLSKYMLGIRMETLNGEVTIDPQPLTLKKLQGYVPTPYGVVTVKSVNGQTTVIKPDQMPCRTDGVKN